MHTLQCTLGVFKLITLVDCTVLIGFKIFPGYERVGTLSKRLQLLCFTLAMCALDDAITGHNKRNVTLAPLPPRTWHISLGTD